MRARPDYYVKRLKAKAHKETVKAKADARRLHSAYSGEVKRIAKSDLTGVQKSRAYAQLANDFCDRFEERLRKRIALVQKMSAVESQRIIDLCLPKGRSGPGEPTIPPYWTTEFKGAIPGERLARMRLRLTKKMRGVTVRALLEAKLPLMTAAEEEEYATVAWQSTESIVATIAGNEPWVAFLLTQAKTYESNEDVIDHYEFLATLDALTCEECGALDGTVIEADQFGNPIAMTEHIDIHPNCRCTVVPVTKTWEQLGFSGIEEPEGTRIAREGYPKGGPGGRDWGKSSPGPDSVQGYVPASTRFKDWKGK